MIKKVSIFMSLIFLCFSLFAQDYMKKVAIMRIEDKTKSINSSIIDSAEEFIRGELIASNIYFVISAERQNNEIMKTMKKESYKKCYERSCQIPLGKALSADTIIQGVITKFGKEYTLRLEMIDLAKEATILGATADFSSTNDFKNAVLSALQQLINPEDDYIRKKLEKAEKEKNKEKALKIYNSANEMAKRDLARAIELYNDVIYILNDEDDPYHKRSVKRREDLQEKVELKKKKERLKSEKEMIAIMKENENYYEGDKFDPGKFKEEISDGDWVYFFKDKHGKYYYNKRTMEVKEDYRKEKARIDVWIRLVVNKSISHQAKVEIYCVDSSYGSARTYEFIGGNYMEGTKTYFDKIMKQGQGIPIPPESLLDYLQAKVCKE